MQVKWLATALQNLDQEASFIAKDDPQAARLVVSRINDAVSLLADNPALGHPGRIHGTRELVVPDTRYIIPYRVRPRLARIEILRVFHSSRKTPRTWGDES
jgi:toxin ParE1/3/4